MCVNGHEDWQHDHTNDKLKQRHNIGFVFFFLSFLQCVPTIQSKNIIAGEIDKMSQQLQAQMSLSQALWTMDNNELPPVSFARKIVQIEFIYIHKCNINEVA